MFKLTLHLLGGEVALDNAGNAMSFPSATWPLVGCLLAAPHHRMNRGALAGTLWPDQDEKSARHCLATALWRTNRRLGDAAGLIRLHNESVSLVCGANVWIDVVAFEQCTRATLDDPARLADRAERDALRQALGHYRGDFMPQVSHDSVEIERERLRALYLDAGLEYARACCRHGEWRLACEMGRAICAVEPFREDAQRLLMEALFECGNVAQALQHYRDFEALLEGELGVRPMAETRALADSIAQASREPAPLPPLAEPADGSHRRMLLLARQQMAASLSLLDHALAQGRRPQDVPAV